MESGEFEIVVDASEAGRRIAVRGDLDLATVDSLRPALDEAISAGTATTLVLSDCTFLDSSALKVIVGREPTRERVRDDVRGLAPVTPGDARARGLGA